MFQRNLLDKGYKMKLFTIRCHNCGDQNPIDTDDRASVKVYFHRGTPNTKDRIVFYCGNCGNQEEHGINWPLDLNKPANPPEQAVEADAESRCEFCEETSCKDAECEDDVW